MCCFGKVGGILQSARRGFDSLAEAAVREAGGSRIRAAAGVTASVLIIAAGVSSCAFLALGITAPFAAITVLGLVSAAAIIALTAYTYTPVGDGLE